MNITAIFIARPVATTLLTIGIVLAGAVAFFRLPVSPLPQIDFPTISVQASLPGASPETVATSVATPLERHLGQIADVSEMTSSSSVGSTRITLQFNLDRNIDGAARDVQAAINAARVDLPAALRSNPTYRKVNPADAPILILSMTSDTLTPGQIYDSAATVVQQKLSQVRGVGQVNVNGSSLPAVRVELNPHTLFKYGIGLEDVRAAIAAANANSPKGAIEDATRHYQIYTNDQARTAAQYRSLIIAYRNGATVRLSDVGEVIDSVEDVRNRGRANGKPAVLVQVSRQPGANIIDTVDRVVALLPQLRASLPNSIDLQVANDRTTTIRAALHDVQLTLLGSVLLVILVVYLFLRNGRAALVPSSAVVVSLVGTFGVMYLLGYSLDNLSLMALTVATGFVVDDAIVVLENITRHIEAGEPRMKAALRGAREVAFTVVSMSLSLIAVFIPILLMGGLVGRLFHEFAVVLSAAILVSLIVSLTTTPMMCAFIIGQPDEQKQGRLLRWSEHIFEDSQRFYRHSLHWALVRPRFVLVTLGLTVLLTIFLYVFIPKGFFPQQDTGRIQGGIRADQSTSFQAMTKKMDQFFAVLQQDPAIQNVTGFTGGAQTNSGNVFIALKPLSERGGLSTDEVIARLRRPLSQIPGADLRLTAVQDLRVGGRQGNGQYQYTLQGDSLDELNLWAPRIVQALQNRPEVLDANSDQQEKGLETNLVIDRTTASRLGLTASQIDNTLYDAFGQRQVSTIYNTLNQYHVVMELAPQYWQSPEALKDIYVSTSGGALSGTASTNTIVGTPATGSTAVQNQSTNQIANSGRGGTSTGQAVSTQASASIPLSAFSSYGPSNTQLSVNHQGPFAATTISFNLPPGEALGTATTVINEVMTEIGVPSSIHGGFQGTAKVFMQSLANQPLLILAALVTIYIVLGILYESLIHPLTILSTIPSAGVGAVLALMICGIEFSLIALIGVLLLIGIVKKNAIMMIDFALDAERRRNLTPEDAIYEACIMRFRPIMMTTLAAILGALPMAIGLGTGAELRQPLGIAIVGGLILSQLLTLYTTPIVYLSLDRMRLRWHAARVRGRRGPPSPATSTQP
jgi:multidrug efflux pump